MGLGKKVLLVFVILIIGGVVFLLSPEPQEAPIELNEQNSQIYYALAEAGIEDAVVDVQNEKVIVDYFLPTGMDKDEALFFVLGAVNGIVQNKAVSLTPFLSEENPLEEINVSVEDLQALAGGSMTPEDLLNKLN